MVRNQTNVAAKELTGHQILRPAVIKSNYVLTFIAYSTTTTLSLDKQNASRREMFKVK